MQIDPRLINLGIIIDGEISWYRNLYIHAKGMKFSNTNAGQCEITIFNLKKSSRERILRETNPLLSNRKLISVVLEVGRVSYGTKTFYQGSVFRSEATPKPDTGVRLKCIIGQNNKSKIVTRSANKLTKLSSIAKWVADDAGYGLSFEITDRNIRSYSFTGSAQSQLHQLEDLANAEVFVDNNTMYVKNINKALGSRVVRKLSAQSGLLEATGTEVGAKMTMLWDPVTNIGGRIDLKSVINPSLNGSYVVFKLGFDVSTRSEPFYLSAECRRL